MNDSRPEHTSLSDHTVLSQPIPYPFSALVGQELLCLALLLNAVHPAIGGVLIRGERGTAKSTAARSLAALLPPRRALALPITMRQADGQETTADFQLPSKHPFVELPLGAGDDRVVGSLDIEKALRHGERHFEPGVLAYAHGGVLYVDEVNLLPDPIVDLLLDVAASGINRVEREGVSIAHPAQFILVGTMNPEEGELRPQLLDRFGLVVDTAASLEPATRAEIVRRRIAFEAEPAEFGRHYAAPETELATRIAAARARLASTQMPASCLDLIAHVCAQAGVDGLRADLTLYKTSVALAAWEAEPEVTVEHIRRAAGLVLPHRQRRRAFDEPSFDPERIEEMLNSFNPTPNREASDMHGRETAAREPESLEGD